MKKVYPDPKIIHTIRNCSHVYLLGYICSYWSFQCSYYRLRNLRFFSLCKLYNTGISLAMPTVNKYEHDRSRCISIDIEKLRAVLRIRIRPDPYSEYASGSSTPYFALLLMGCKAKLIGIIHKICRFMYKKNPGPLSVISNNSVL